MTFPLQRRTVVLTGAASGIGAALAHLLANRGADLALVDRDSAGLETVAATAGQSGVRVRTYPVDLSVPSAIEGLPHAVAGDLAPASALINNAGIAMIGSFEQTSAEQFDRIVAVNFSAQVNMVRAFLPQLRANTPAQIVNLSSIFGIGGVPGQVAYCASKFAVRGFSEALRAEFAPGDIGVSVVHPGGVRTNITTSATVAAGMDARVGEERRRFNQQFLRMNPKRAAARILKGLLRREKRIVVGYDASYLTLAQRLLPVSYLRVLPTPKGYQLD